MAPQATADEVNDHEQQGNADGVEPDQSYPERCSGVEPPSRPRSGVIAGTGCKGNLRYLAPAVSGHALGLVHIKYLDYEQHQQSNAGMEEFAP